MPCLKIRRAVAFLLLRCISRRALFRLEIVIFSQDVSVLHFTGITELTDAFFSPTIRCLWSKPQETTEGIRRARGLPSIRPKSQRFGVHSFRKRSNTFATYGVVNGPSIVSVGRWVTCKCRASLFAHNMSLKASINRANTCIFLTPVTSSWGELLQRLPLTLDLSLEPPHFKASSNGERQKGQLQQFARYLQQRC